MGTFTTDEISISENTSNAVYEKVYVDTQTGLIVSISISGGSTGNITAEIASTNVPDMAQNSAYPSLSPTEMYGVIGGAVAAIAILSAFAILRKRR